MASSRVEVIEGTLKVNSFDTYEDLITGKEKLSIRDFNSFQKGFDELKQSGENLRISQEGYNEITAWEGSTLLELLDQDGFIILEDYLIYLNFNNRTAVVSTDLNLKDEILAGDISSESIRLFKFEDDVIGLLEINSPSTKSKESYNLKITNFFVPAPTIGNDCTWDKCDNNGDANQNKFDPITSTEYRLEAKHVYQAAAVYFRLMSEAKHMKRGGNLTYTAENTNSYIRYDYWYDSKKSSIGIKFGTGESYKFINDHNLFYYESSRGLNSYRLDTQFEVFIGGSHGSGTLGWWLFNLQRISKN